VLFAVSVKVPVPTFVRPPPPDITPEKVVLLLLEPSDRTELVGTKTLPEPANEPIASEPTTENSPPEERINGALSFKKPVLARASLP
jgi:hypothetical protein